MTVKRSAKVIKLQPPLRCAEPTPADMELEQDDIAWATRSSMWQSRVAKASARRTKRAKAPPALILAGQGVSLRSRKWRADHPKWIYALPAAARDNPLFPPRRGAAPTHYFIGRQRQQFLRRSSPYHLAGNRNAAHPVNAILNYAYAALESEIRIKAISDGYDPTIGIMHEGGDGSSKFIFDLMEPERPNVDRAVLDFVKAHVFDPADFVIRADGVCRLNPEMARMVGNRPA